MNPPESSLAIDNSRRQSRRRWLPLIIFGFVLLAFALGVAWNIGLPGLYMDAVNPDYMVVSVLDHERFPVPVWIQPGNMLWNRFPLLPALYHGSLHVWLGLPVYLLLGVNLTALRIAQALFGAAILYGLFALLRRARPEPAVVWLAGLAALALAIDPVFTFAFRTQLYITLSPTAWLFGALLLGHAALRPRDDGHARWLILLAGACYGLAVFGYFIFGFFAPALAIALILRSRKTGLQRSGLTAVSLCLWLTAGLALGGIGYLLGYLRIYMAEGSLANFLEFLSKRQDSLGAFNSRLSITDTADYFWTLVRLVFSNAWQHSLMFGERSPQWLSGVKLSLLLGLPCLLWIVSEVVRKPSGWLRLALGLIVSFAMVALVFGNRLSGHHFAVLLPLSYLALGIGLIKFGLHGRRGVIVVALVWTVLIVINIAGQFTTQQQLEATGGRRLFSDAINRFAADALIQRRDQFVVMPDWGLMLPFQFLTDGQIEHTGTVDNALILKQLCTGRSVAVALIKDDPEGRLRTLTSEIGWAPPALQEYDDREDNRVFIVGTYASDPTIAATRGCAVATPTN